MKAIPQFTPRKADDYTPLWGECRIVGFCLPDCGLCASIAESYSLSQKAVQQTEPRKFSQLRPDQQLTIRMFHDGCAYDEISAALAEIGVARSRRGIQLMMSNPFVKHALAEYKATNETPGATK